MMKYLYAVAAALVLALAGWGYYGHAKASALAVTVASQKTTIEQQGLALKAHEAKIKRDKAALADRAKRQAATDKQQKESANAKEQAIAANPAWSDGAVPADIADWLRRD